MLSRYRILSLSIYDDLDTIRSSYRLYGTLDELVRYANDNEMNLSTTLLRRIEKLNETKIYLFQILNAIESLKQMRMTMSNRITFINEYKGELMSFILKRTFCDEDVPSISQILFEINEKYDQDISEISFKKLKRQAIERVSKILWVHEELENLKSIA